MGSWSDVSVRRGAGQRGRGGRIALSGMIVAVCAHNRHRTLTMEVVRPNGPLGGAFLKPRPMDVVDYCFEIRALVLRSEDKVTSQSRTGGQ